MPPPTNSALPLNVAPGSRPQTAQSNLSTATSTTAGAPKPASAPDISSPHELTAFVESLLEQLDQKFDDMSNQILDRMTQMSSRVDALEASIQDIINSDTPGQPPSSLPQSPLVPSMSQRKSGASG
ncbi:heat shock factor binding protein 1-domain-containing protein [Epithele typhae]|uniref:heat shock factor binding protein 1-domain-containing protein n=1 Tax=Epithele typhae TaxID=378194 RepID=UPI0020079129|nr:heat shock factor binding protein 1-domain-containing protein [Epithele typhae]KAH9945418.1 heat shock factor binding protein 1-domain-containing protein [Epithele typhae]